MFDIPLQRGRLTFGPRPRRPEDVAVPDTDEQKQWVERFSRPGASSLDEALGML